LISNVYPDQVAAAERKLKHKLYPVNAMLEVKHCFAFEQMIGACPL
jgi:hypothetical protein